MTAWAVVLVTAIVVTATPLWGHPEGGTKPLRDALTVASQGYTDAKSKMDGAKKRQTEISAEVTTSEAKVAELAIGVSRLASVQYRGGKANEFSVLLNSSSTESFLRSAATVRHMEDRDIQKLNALQAAQKQLADQRRELDAAILEQEAQIKVLKKSRDDALTALRDAGGGDPTLGFGDLPANAQASPRNSNGSWSNESCSVQDPTTNGCLTPRTLHALNQTQAAGFARYVSCYRSTEDGGEHPRGRACDFASHSSGFQDSAASGGDRDYGNRLAAWLIANADRLAVLYVIWYRQIWLPGIGWRAYSGGGGAAAEHTNHVHLSIR
ncbi:MAG: hypothetical protein H0T78_02755 [Longispora sp.]|nr:hypothetical protein [Longispora sp. (in: high G+C Gram-positive bacteria)]